MNLTKEGILHMEKTAHTLPESATGWLLWMMALVLCSAPIQPGKASGESLGEIAAKVSAEFSEAYTRSPFSFLSKDFFLRFSHDPMAVPSPDETAIDSTWVIKLSPDTSQVNRRMAVHLQDFLKRIMGADLAIEADWGGQTPQGDKQVILLEKSSDTGQPEGSFSLAVGPSSVMVQGKDIDGLRDGIVELVHRIGFREAPILARGTSASRPRIAVRLGAVPLMGSNKDLVFMGYNTVFVGGGSLYGLSRSDAIPELVSRRDPSSLDNLRQAVNQASEYNLKSFTLVDIRQKFPADDPLFKKYPDLRGALTWKADGEYVLCTEHPLFQKYLEESVEELFRSAPGLSGMTLIIGGEGFYHCYMRPFGVKKGHTNCSRCEPLGAETVVANLLNRLAAAARLANPEALIVAWPYSAEHVWSADPAQAGLIEKLGPGTAIFTEIEKDEYVEKGQGVRKHLWDYSIDLIGPGARAENQIAACRKQGIPIFLKSEPELAFEAPRLPHVPCLDRWVDRAEALASCGADGAWVFPAFRSNYGTSAAEVNRFFWWDPVPNKDTTLEKLAARIAGDQAGPHLRKAWAHVSEAIPFSPELPSYYNGPYYLGPAQPMCVSPEAELPPVFYGRYFFLAEMTESEGLALRPTFVTSPTGNVPVFGEMYREMEKNLKLAVEEIDRASDSVPERNRHTFRAEEIPIRWFYHTVRTEANFYESCRIRDSLREAIKKEKLSQPERESAQGLMKRWEAVLKDELDNAKTALPLQEQDIRLDFYFGGDHSFSHGTEMIQAKIDLLEGEISRELPAIKQKLGL